MQLDEYTTPAPDFATEFEARPDASRIVARKHRANALSPAAPAPPARLSLPLDKAIPIAVGAFLTLALAIVLGSSLGSPKALVRPVPTVAPESTPAAALTVPTVAPTVRPTATQLPAPTVAPQSGQGLTIEQPAENVPAVAPETAVDIHAPATAPTIQAIGAWIGATSTATYATAASLGVPGGVIPWTPTPEVR
jgi:hypothetical protein